MKHILFVDDDRSVLDGLRRLLYPYRGEWQLSFANSGSEALEALEKSAFDAIVTDIRMPGMDGTELLRVVKQRHPDVVRVVLSGQADRDMSLRSAATAHQYLSKPCEAETLRSTIARATALGEMFNEPSLKGLIVSGRPLPSVPALYRELVRRLESDDSSVKEVAKIVAKDTAMTAKVLQLANSAFFGLRRRIVDPHDAVVYLGFDTVRALTLAIKVFAAFNTSKCPGFSVDALSHHGVLTGALARNIATAMGSSHEEIEDAFLAGLLHDVGKLVLVDALPEEYKEVLRVALCTGVSHSEAELGIFGTTHAEVGTYLLWLWGLPDSVIEAVAYHHLPNRCAVPQQKVLLAVHAANVLSDTSDRLPIKPVTPQFDEAYLDLLGLRDHIALWQSLAAETKAEQAAV